MEMIQTNVKHVKCKYREKMEGVNEKFQNMEEKIAKADKDKKLYSMKHRELESLKF